MARPHGVAEAILPGHVSGQREALEYESELNKYRADKADTSSVQMASHRRYVESLPSVGGAPEPDAGFNSRLYNNSGVPNVPLASARARNHRDNVGDILDHFRVSTPPTSRDPDSFAPHLRRTTGAAAEQLLLPTIRSEPRASGIRMQRVDPASKDEGFNIISNLSPRQRSLRDLARSRSPSRRLTANSTYHSHDIISPDRDLLRSRNLAGTIAPDVRSGERRVSQASGLAIRHRPRDHNVLLLSSETDLPDPRPEGVARASTVPGGDRAFDIITGHRDRSAPGDLSPRSPRRPERSDAAPRSNFTRTMGVVVPLPAERPHRRSAVEGSRNSADNVGALLVNRSPPADVESDAALARRRHYDGNRDSGSWIIGNDVPAPRIDWTKRGFGADVASPRHAAPRRADDDNVGSLLAHPTGERRAAQADASEPGSDWRERMRSELQR